MKAMIEYDGKTFYRNQDGYYNHYTGIGLHRYKWLKEVGPIPKEHVVHHIDINPSNNDLYNLCLITRSHHQIYHNAINETLCKGEKNPMYGKKHKESSLRIMSNKKIGNKNPRRAIFRNLFQIAKEPTKINKMPI